MAILETALASGKAALFIKNNSKPILYILLSIVIIVGFGIIAVISMTMVFFGVNNIPLGYVGGAELFGKGLGALSEEYESNGDPGIIADNEGDIGKKSYGAWQIASGVGSMDSFLRWLSKKDTYMYTELTDAKNSDGGFGKKFDKTWKDLSKKDKDYFYQIQWLFIKETHYDPVVKHYSKSNIIDFSSRTLTLRNVVWSVAVQHGTAGAKSLFNTTNLKVSDKLEDDKQIIIDLYDERMNVDKYFSSSSEDIKVSVFNRFIKEKSQALSMLEFELNNLKSDNEVKKNENE